MKIFLFQKHELKNIEHKLFLLFYLFISDIRIAYHLTSFFVYISFNRCDIKLMGHVENFK